MKRKVKLRIKSENEYIYIQRTYIFKSNKIKLNLNKELKVRPSQIKTKIILYSHPQPKTKKTERNEVMQWLTPSIHSKTVRAKTGSFCVEFACSPLYLHEFPLSGFLPQCKDMQVRIICNSEYPTGEKVSVNWYLSPRFSPEMNW